MVSKSNKLLIGSFVSMNKADKYLLGSLKEALACDENCLMFYNGSPQTINRPNINEININEFQTKCNENNIKLVNIIVHSPYIINLATNEIAKKEFTFNILLNEVERTHKIGSKYIVVHPGNATNGMERSIAIKNVADMINKINKINKNVCLCLETMSGKGNEIGVTFSELKQIILLVDNKELIGICLDTCHTWDYGYDWNDSELIFKEFDKVIGLKYLKVVHLNDSKNELNAHKDRHENIGYGKIGFKNLLDICYSPYTKNIPKILETPIIDSIIHTYKKEVEMIRNKKFIDWKNN